MKIFLSISLTFLIFTSSNAQDVAFVKSTPATFTTEKSDPIAIVPASFKDGHAALTAYFKNHIIYPEKALEYGIEGKVKLLVQLNEKGQVKGTRIVESLERSCDVEAQRVVMAMPDWQPAYASGKAVESTLLLSVKF